MYARAEQYRRRAIEARQRAGQTKDDAIQRSNFELIAESWIELAEQVEWLETVFRQRNGPLTAEQTGALTNSNSKSSPGPRWIMHVTSR